MTVTAEQQIPTPDVPDVSPPSPQRKKSPGEHAFDRIVYTGIGFFANEVISLLVTDQFRDGKNFLKGIPLLDKLGSAFSSEGYKAASNYLAKIFKTSPGKAGNGLLMVMLLSGGTLLLKPMKWLEDNKIHWVTEMNHVIDWMSGKHKTPEQVAARDEEVEKAIACSPRQSWGTMLVGRLIAMCSSVLTGIAVGEKRNNQLMDASEKFFAGSLQPEGSRNMWHRLTRLVSVETYSCAVSSSVLELSSKFFAKRHGQPHDPEICAADSKPSGAPVTDESGKADCKKCHEQPPHAAKVQMRREQQANMQTMHA